MRINNTWILLLSILFVQACQIDQENGFVTADPVFSAATRISVRETLTCTPEGTEIVVGIEASVTPFCNTADYETELPDPDVPENYIGRYFGPKSTFPEEITFLTATCIGSDCSHSVVEVKKGKHVLVLDR